MGFCFGNGVFAKEINLKNVVFLVNQSRLENGLNGLFINPTLNKVANDKAKDMIINNYFAHTSPKGLTPWYWFKKNNYNYSYAGENLAINYQTAEKQHQAWMNSPTHRKNILNPNYTEIGVATTSGYINNNPAFITVQVFGNPEKTNSLGVFGANTTKKSLLLNNQFNYKKQKNIYLNPYKKTGYSSQKSNYYLSDNFITLFTEKYTHKILFIIILLLSILIIRDITLSSLSNFYFFKKHSTTNLVLLLLLWSLLVTL